MERIVREVFKVLEVPEVLKVLKVEVSEVLGLESRVLSLYNSFFIFINPLFFRDRIPEARGRGLPRDHAHRPNRE